MCFVERSFLKDILMVADSALTFLVILNGGSFKTKKRQTNISDSADVSTSFSAT